MSDQNKDYEKEFFDSLVARGRHKGVLSEFCDYALPVLDKCGVVLHGRMLDVGCGFGAIGKMLLQRYSDLEVFGVDISERMIKEANDGTAGFSAVVGDVEVTSLFAKDSFDFVLCHAVLHHFPDVGVVFSNLGTWLKDGGLIIVMEPNGSSVINKVSEALRKAVQLFLGERFIMEKGFATPNETYHSVRRYENVLRRGKWVLEHLSTFCVPNKKPQAYSIFWIRDILHLITKSLFPNTPFFGSGTFIIAKKEVE